MKVLQLIDSLDAGGAERVAINIANALSLNKDFKSFLCATRKEGLLKNNLNKNVGYVFLNKKFALDVFAIKKLNQFIAKHKIDIIHAHSTSFFLATLIKWLNPSLNIVWHDHYGNSEFLIKRKYKVLNICSKRFSHIICVTHSLKDWAIKKLSTKNITYIPNFAVQDNCKPLTNLKGIKGKRILHLANLRPQKDHFTLLKAFNEVIKAFPEYTLHCVGKNFDDDYSKQIKELIYKLNLNKSVFFYESKKDVSNILSQSDICVLSSKSEGLPIALLEYGLAGKTAIVTNVGNCSQVIKNEVNGVLVPKEDPQKLAEALCISIKNQDKAKGFGKQLKQTVEKEYSQEVFVNKLMDIYNSV